MVRSILYKWVWKVLAKVKTQIRCVGHFCDLFMVIEGAMKDKTIPISQPSDVAQLVRSNWLGALVWMWWDNIKFQFPKKTKWMVETKSVADRLFTSLDQTLENIYKGACFFTWILGIHVCWNLQNLRCRNSKMLLKF